MGRPHSARTLQCPAGRDAGLAPRAAARVAGSADLAEWATANTPALAAVLDVGLSELPIPDRRFAYGMDSPFYFSVHGPPADLGDGVVLHAMKYLSHSDTSDAAALRAQIESFVERVQPGWRDRVVTERFLRKMTVAHALTTPDRTAWPGDIPTRSETAKASSSPVIGSVSSATCRTRRSQAQPPSLASSLPAEWAPTRRRRRLGNGHHVGRARRWSRRNGPAHAIIPLASANVTDSLSRRRSLPQACPTRRCTATHLVYYWCMARTNIDIDEELCRKVMDRFHLSTKREAVNLALQHLAGEPLDLAEARSLRGSGWDGDLDEMRSSRA